MKTYKKYMNEFETIFEKNIELNIDLNTLEMLNTKYTMCRATTNFNPFYKDEFIKEINIYAKVSNIIEDIGNELCKIDIKMQKTFIELIDPENTLYVRKDKYLKATKAISLYMAVDKDMSHSLNNSEMGTLIWLLSGKEPNEKTLQDNIAKLDANGDSAIELSEWIDYLSTIDCNGKRTINYTLKHKFDMYDTDGSGTISINELEKLILDSFSNLINNSDDNNKSFAESIVKDLAKIIMKKMDIDNSNNLDWIEFKNYIRVASIEEKKIASIIENFLTTKSVK